MAGISIRAENLSKLYRPGPRERYKTLRDTLTGALYVPFGRLQSAFQRQGIPRFIWRQHLHRPERTD